VSFDIESLSGCAWAEPQTLHLVILNTAIGTPSKILVMLLLFILLKNNDVTALKVFI